MPLHQPLELLRDIEDGLDEYEHAIFGTYKFDPAFFENRLLPILHKKDAGNILVLIDRSEYTNKFNEIKKAGRWYYLDYCRCGKIFHPKFVLLTWPEGGKLLITRANLTDYEWLTAGELVISLNYNIENQNQDIKSCFFDMREFLFGLIKNNLLKSKKHKIKLKETIFKTDWLKKIDNHEFSKKIRILHNLDKAILPQVLEMIDKEKIVQAKIISPFFDGDASVLKELTKAGCKDFQLYIQPEEVNGFPRDEIIKMKKSGTDIKIKATHFKENEHRFIHAKLLILNTKSSSYCLVGSANATQAGMLSTAKDGNVELCVLRREEKRNYFDYILHPQIFNFKDMKPQDLEERKILYFSGSYPDLCLIDARLEEKELVIEFEFQSHIKSQHATVLLWHHGESKSKSYKVQIEDRTLVRVKLDEDGYLFCSKPTYVELKIESEGDVLHSDKRWLSTEFLESIPPRRDVEMVRKTHGRHGLIRVFNQLAKVGGNPEWFLYYLQFVDFKNLVKSLNRIRRQLRKIADAEENYEFQLEKYSNADPIKIIDKIINQYKKRFIRDIEQFSIDEKLSENIENLFNMFMFINKITLWFVIMKIFKIQKLRYIRGNLENLNKLLQKLQKEAPKELTGGILKKLQITAHLMILCFIVDYIHRHRSYATKNKNVVEVFRKTYSKVLRELVPEFNDINAFNKYLPEVTQASKEYEEFEELKLKPEIIVRFCREMVKYRP